jgi:hypothetical protein
MLAGETLIVFSKCAIQKNIIELTPRLFPFLTKVLLWQTLQILGCESAISGMEDITETAFKQEHYGS